MQCDQGLQVQRFHDGELDARSAREIEAHVASCASCRDLLADLRDLSGRIAAAQLPDLEVARLNRITHAAWHASNDRGVRRLAGWITAAAAAVMVFALIDWPSRNQNGSVSGPGQSAMIGPASFASADWEQAAIMPPTSVSLASEDPNREMEQFYQWMTSDLGVGADPSRQR